MKIRTFYIVLFLVFVVLGIYYPSVFAPINTVDDKAMVLSIMNSSHFSFKGLFFPGISGYYYRPLLGLTFYADDSLWGLQPSFMHLENILLHALNVILVFLVARGIFKRHGLHNILAQLSAALLFALHPINTEPVNWISGRTDLLAGTFILLSMLLLLRALESNRILTCALASFSLLLACFAKDVAIFFFPASLLMIWHFDESREDTLYSSLLSSLKRRALFYASFFFVVLAYFTCRRVAFNKADTGIAQAAGGIIGHEVNILYTLKVMVKLLGFYAKKLFFPWPLNFAITKVPNYYIIVGVMVLVAAVYMFYRRELLADLFLTSICVISPAFLVALNRMAWTPIAERYLYIPCATFSIGITLVVYCLCKKMRFEKYSPILVVLICATSAFATVNRNIVWQDNLTLYEDTVRKSPDFPPAQNELAVALKEHGKDKEGNRIIKSNQVPEGTKNREFAELNRANVLTAEGDLDSARRLLLDNLNPNSAVYNNILTKLINIDECRLNKLDRNVKTQQIRAEIIGFLSKLQANTGDAFYNYRIGQYYLAMGDTKDARNCFATAYEKAPAEAYYKLPAKKLADKLRQ